MSQNGTALKQNTEVEKLSIQARVEETKGAATSSFFFHRLAGLDDIIAPWWSPQRDVDLRAFWKKTGNDILQGAVSSMVKKIKATGWTVEGGQRVANRYQELLANAEFGQGWGQLMGKTLIDFCTQDKGAFWELIGDGPTDGPIKNGVKGIAHLDSGLCQLTGNPTYPVLFWNTKQDKSEAHKLHVSRVVHLVDMPSPIEVMNNTGFCAVSRVISSSQILLKLQQYKNEKLSDLPAAGILALNNIMSHQFEDAQKDYQQETRKLGSNFWRNIMVLTSLDPSQPISLDFTSFSDLPEHFNELESTNIYINILALAFGVDVREFWPLSGGSLGTATESEVMHQKAKGKGPGEIYSSIERAINWKVFPPSVTFSFDYVDDDEDLQRANINDTKTKTIMSMWQPTKSGSTDEQGGPVSRLEIRQMLADNVSDYFSEEFLIVDVTDEVEVTDTEREKAIGQKCKIDQSGKVKILEKKKQTFDNITEVIVMAEKNYKAGKIDLDTLLEFRLGNMTDGITKH